MLECERSIYIDNFGGGSDTDRYPCIVVQSSWDDEAYWIFFFFVAESLLEFHESEFGVLGGDCTVIRGTSG